ncbi:hypothetical protein V7S43_004072 [Phytophthora oleae]|uniref:BMERB domain-containing protein n=1 Tax=Phytophthora oleae TaxID=2107226 RepID=A0ABD3FWX5_9STRA
MITALPSDNNELVSLFTHDGTPRLSSRLDSGFTSSESMSLTSTELSDDSSLTNDDLVVLSDLFGFTNGSTTSSSKAKRATPTASRGRKRPRTTTVVADDGSVLPKSQQQRQKLEIEFLKKQIVELQATVEDLQTRKLERERKTIEKLVEDEECDDSAALNQWVGVAKSQISAVQQLEEQNEKLRVTVADHLGQLKQLEQIARTRYLTNAIPEPMQLTGHSTPYYSASC